MNLKLESCNIQTFRRRRTTSVPLSEETEQRLKECLQTLTVKDIIPLGTQRQTSADGCQSTVLPRMEARSRSRAQASSLLIPSPAKATDYTPQKEPDSKSMMGPPFTRSANQSDGNMLLRSSMSRLSRSTKLRTFTPAKFKKQQSSLTKKRNPVQTGPSCNSSSERKHLDEASSSKTDPSTFHMGTIQKMLRDGNLLQPRLVLKRLRESDLDSPLDVKRSCLNNDEQAHATGHPFNPGRKDIFLHPPTPPKPVCKSSQPQETEETITSTDATHPEHMVTHISTDVETSSQPECMLTHTSTDVTASSKPECLLISPCVNGRQADTPLTTISECNSASLCDTDKVSQTKPASTSTNCTQPNSTFRYTPTDSVQREQTDTSPKTHPALKPVTTEADTTDPTSNMAHISTYTSHPSSRPSDRPINPPQHHYQAPTPLQPSPTFSSTQSTSRLTSTSSSTKDAHRVTFRSPHPSASPASHTSRPLPTLIRPQMSLPIHSPTHNQTCTNVVSRPTVTPSKPVSAHTKTPSYTVLGVTHSTHAQTPTKPVSTLTKTPIPTHTVSEATNSLTPAKPAITFAKTPASTESGSRPTYSHTPRTVSTARNAALKLASGSACTPPIHSFFQRRVPPIRHLAPSPPPGPTDAKQPCVSSSPLPAARTHTPPKYVQCAFMKRGEKGLVMLREKRSQRGPPCLPQSVPSPSSSSSASSTSSLPAVAVKTLARKLFSEVDSQLGNEETIVSLQPSPAPSVGDPPGCSPVLTPLSPSPPMDNMEEILTPDSLPTSAGMDVDMASPEPSQDSLSHSPSQTSTMVTEPAEATATLAKAENVLDEPGSLKTGIHTLKVGPDTNPSQAGSNKDSFNRPQAPTGNASPSHSHSPKVVWIDPLDDDLAFDTGLDCSLSDTSSSEDEKLLSLQEIMERSVRPPLTPDKEAFSEPNTPVAARVPVEQIKVKPVHYNNTLDQMLIERKQNEKSKQLEEQLLQGCREDLLMMEEEDEVDVEKEEEISQEQHKFVQRYTLTASTIRDLHPGEELFSLASFGRLFTQDTLHLPQGIDPKNTAQRCLLRASPKQALLLVQAGLLKMAYASSPCQAEVSRWLLQMMSVHSNPCMSAQILHSLKHLALIAGLKIAESQDTQFQVWVPSVQDVVLLFLNMGVPFISMFPLEMLQPPFSEADLLGSAVIGPEGMSCGSDHATFPEHNFDNVIKYLSVCAALCPRAYSDQELVLLLTLVCRLSLDTQLQLLPTASLSNLMLHLISNITDWDIQMPLVCRALTDLTDDHHNLRRLVQLLPPNNRGRSLRRHLSLSIISKLLNQKCTYKPAGSEFQLSDLRRYVPHMTPSVLKKCISRRVHEQDEALLDQQAYYLCYSLLDLTNEASNYEFLRPDQKNQLKLLSAQLEKHVKCDIRESEKCLYRSKVKDYVARIYTRWQVLLQRTRPAQGKLYDFWEPLSEDALSSSQEEPKEHQRRQQRALEPEESLAQEGPEDVAAEEMKDVSSGDETLIEEVTMIEEQLETEPIEEKKEEESNGEKKLSKEEEVDKIEGPPTGEEGLLVQEEGLQVEDTNKRKKLESEKGVDMLEEHPTEGMEEPERRSEMPVKEDEELAMEEETTREEGLGEKEAAVKDKVLVMEERSPREKEQPAKEAQVEEIEMEVELPEEQEQAMEVRVEAGEQQVLSREEAQAEEVKMMETHTESPEQGRPNTVEPMAEGEAEARKELVGEKMVDAEVNGN